MDCQPLDSDLWLLHYIAACSLCKMLAFFCSEGPRSRCYGRTAALRLIVQPCDEDEEKDDQFFFIFPSNKAPGE
jgi:hypothetical protein